MADGIVCQVAGCALCGAEIPTERIENSLKMRKAPAAYCSRKCQRIAKRRRNYWSNRESKVAKQKARMLALQPEEAKARKRRWRKAVRNRYAAAGLTAKGTQRKRPLRGMVERCLWELNAKQAWQWWLKTCPDWWLRAYFRAQGRPWANPRLTDAQSWRIRYWLDADFRAKEYERLQKAKKKRYALMRETSDGSLTGAVVQGLFDSAKRCPDCGEIMRRPDKSLDHIVPLSKGGQHRIGNVRVVCLPCNGRKGSKMPAQSVPEQLIHGRA